MHSLPSYINVIFEFTTLISIWILCRASNRPNTTLIMLLLWLVIQMILGISGFFREAVIIPPRIALMPAPPILLILVLFATKIGRAYIDHLNPRLLTILHIIRIPVEMVLLWLSIHEAVPVLMTFEGRNFDILSGLTAPIIYYFGFVKKKIGRFGLLAWNFICLGLLVNIVTIAVLSLPFPFQKLAFEQPNVAVLYFPFNWLPSVVVPIVLFSHLAMIRQLILKKNLTSEVKA